MAPPGPAARANGATASAHSERRSRGPGSGSTIWWPSSIVAGTPAGGPSCPPVRRRDSRSRWLLAGVAAVDSARRDSPPGTGHADPGGAEDFDHRRRRRRRRWRRLGWSRGRRRLWRRWWLRRSSGLRSRNARAAVMESCREATPRRRPAASSRRAGETCRRTRERQRKPGKGYRESLTLQSLPLVPVRACPRQGLIFPILGVTRSRHQSCRMLARAMRYVALSVAVVVE